MSSQTKDPGASLRYIIAADEVGRGALAGPLAVGAVTIPDDVEVMPKARDSKRTSPEGRRAFTEAFPYPRVVSYSSAETVSREGITAALRGCFKDAILGAIGAVYADGVSVVSEVRIDGQPLPGFTLHPLKHPIRFIVKGDALDWRIGAASMIAKHSRDEHMKKLAQEYPGYGWEENKGYGTKSHTDAILRRGLTPEHRSKWCLKFLPEVDEDVLDLFDLVSGP